MDDQPNNGHTKNWLQRVAEQSWEPELLISGVAIYATIQLPAFVREFYQYYRYNLQLDTGFIDELMPIIVVGVALTALKVLSFAFIFHLGSPQSSCTHPPFKSELLDIFGTIT